MILVKKAFLILLLCLLFSCSVYASDTSTSKIIKGTLSTTGKDIIGLTPEEYIETVAPIYVSVMKKNNLLPSVWIAMSCVETGYGQGQDARVLVEKANNMHGMKSSLSGNSWANTSWDGVSTISKETPEVYNGVATTIIGTFRKYKTIGDSIQDVAAYMLGAEKAAGVKRYEGIEGNTDYEDVIKKIKNGGYATDPNYVSKLVSIVKQWDLTKYDSMSVNLSDSASNSDATTYSIGSTIVGEWDLEGMPKKGTFSDDQVIPELPTSSDLSPIEYGSISLIRLDLDNYWLDRYYQWGRVFIVFLGLWLVVYGLFLAMFCLVDRVNILFDFSMVRFLTFGKAEVDFDSSEASVGESFLKGSKSEKGYMGLGRFIRLVFLVMILGFSLVSGVLWRGVYEVINWVGSLFI